MSGSQRAGIASFAPEEFALLHNACENAGYRPVLYVHTGALRPNKPADDSAPGTVGQLVRAVPPGVGLALPGTSAELAPLFTAYRLDLLVVYGFNWRVPRDARDALRHGALNIHTSLLPRYRGPAPVLWSIRNGDQETGVTVHRMDDGFDTGPILAQVGGVQIEDDVTPDGLAERLRPAIGVALAQALDRFNRGEPGEPQPEQGASYAGFLEPEFRTVDWSRTARQVHDQVRVYRYIGTPDAPVGVVDGHRVAIRRTSLTPGAGTRVECADGPLWVVESAPATE